MSDIFDNAIDSLEVGIRFYINDEFETAHKHAILTVFHSIELFLKERLYRANPLLIYKNIDKLVGDDSITVGLNEIVIRYENLGIKLSKDDVATLKDLQARRNKIEHFRFEDDLSHFYVIGKALKFLYYFLPSHLDSKLENFLDKELYEKLRQMILEYDELLSEAKQEVARLTTPLTKDDEIEMTPSAFCPECGNRTVVIGMDRGHFCFFCKVEVDLEQCDCCGEYLSASELEGSSICSNCFRARLEADHT